MFVMYILINMSEIHDRTTPYSNNEIRFTFQYFNIKLMSSNDFFFKFYMFIIKVFTRNKIKYVTETPNTPWSYGSLIYNYLCNRFLSPLSCEFEYRPGRGVQHYVITFASVLCSPGTPVSSTNKTDRHDINEILLKVALNTIKPN